MLAAGDAVVAFNELAVVAFNELAVVVSWKLNSFDTLFRRLEKKNNTFNTSHSYMTKENTTLKYFLK